jgi:hypothetical protein
LTGYVVELGTSRGYEASVGLGLGARGIGLALTKEERLFASTEGSLTTQTVITTQPNIAFSYRNVPTGIPYYNFPVQAGWERLANMPLHDLIQQAMDRVDTVLAGPLLPVKPVEVGRYHLALRQSSIVHLAMKPIWAVRVTWDRTLSTF